MHTSISPPILYFGTPIVLITTLNSDLTTNMAPMSSAWWLGDRCVLGLSSTSATTQNLLRTKQCVLNLPSEDLVHAVNALARTTGSDALSEFKSRAGYRIVRDKFACAGLSPQQSQLVHPARIEECPVQMEAELSGVFEMMQDSPGLEGAFLALEVKVVKVHIEEELQLPGHKNRVNAERLRPMFMVFQEYFGMARQKLEKSNLAEIDEETYRLRSEHDGPENESI